MSINVNRAGLNRPVNQQTAILYYAKAGEITADTALGLTVDGIEAGGFTSAGAISTDGISLENDGGSDGGGDNLQDFNGNVIETTAGTAGTAATKTISFTLLEVMSKAAMSLAYDPATIEEDESGFITKVVDSNPSQNMSFLLLLRVKDRYKKVFIGNASFASREGDFNISNDELAGVTVSYNVLSSEGGDIITKYEKIAA